MAESPAEWILELVEEAPGKYTVDQVVNFLRDDFKESTVRKSLSIMLSKPIPKIHIRDGRLYTGINPDNVKKPEIVNPQQPQPAPKNARVIQPDFKVDVEVNDQARLRQMSAVFHVIEAVERVKNIGVSPTDDINSVIWFPPGSNVMKVFVGDFDGVINSGMTLVKAGYYLVIVVSKDGKNGEARFYRSRPGNEYAIVWDKDSDKQ